MSSPTSFSVKVEGETTRRRTGRTKELAQAETHSALAEEETKFRTSRVIDKIKRHKST